MQIYSPTKLCAAQLFFPTILWKIINIYTYFVVITYYNSISTDCVLEKAIKIAIMFIIKSDIKCKT